jgi:hypothetical protein
MQHAFLKTLTVVEMIKTFYYFLGARRLHLEQWIVCTHLSVNVFVTLAIQ